MVLPQFHISHDNFFETVRSIASNPPAYSNWRNLSGLRKYEQPVRSTRDTALQRYGHTKDVITQEAQITPTEDRKEQELTMEDIPLAED